MLIAQLTDLHLTAGPEGDAAAHGAALAVAAINALRPGASAVVVTGDVTDDGSPDSYRRAAEILSQLSAPTHVIPGNHDDHAALRAQFGLPGPGDRQGVVEVNGLALLLCDSTLPGTDAGALDHGRLEWIDARLGELSGRPALVAVHHPPIVTGITAMDEVGLAGISDFTEVLAGHAEVLGVISGHLHRAITGRVAHAPVVVCPSTFVQVRLDFESDAVSMVGEPAAIVIHRVNAAGDLVSHFQPTGSFPAV